MHMATASKPIFCFSLKKSFKLQPVGWSCLITNYIEPSLAHTPQRFFLPFKTRMLLKTTEGNTTIKNKNRKKNSCHAVQQSEREGQIDFRQLNNSKQLVWSWSKNINTYLVILKNQWNHKRWWRSDQTPFL